MSTHQRELGHTLLNALVLTGLCRAIGGHRLPSALQTKPGPKLARRNRRSRVRCSSAVAERALELRGMSAQSSNHLKLRISPLRQHHEAHRAILWSERIQSSSHISVAPCATRDRRLQTSACRLGWGAQYALGDHPRAHLNQHLAFEASRAIVTMHPRSASPSLNSPSL
jgi:hypothetical protein